MATTNNSKSSEKKPWVRLLLFILFLILLAVILNRLGWCFGGMCDVGTDLLIRY